MFGRKKSTDEIVVEKEILSLLIEQFKKEKNELYVSEKILNKGETNTASAKKLSEMFSEIDCLIKNYQALLDNDINMVTKSVGCLVGTDRVNKKMWNTMEGKSGK